ncbi:uncharacterized protein PHALS_03358 [Plasmopara halstedii]|uniref:Uncharacterized protein n=1 Tax=Plasmopara halstedii TaxID=4781 RepID=A0A0P1A838_PLAHL|nr:uncharacterized protein PHALS_03358 [Plasmopara halstedii]CEG36690.1 hypothetical protein PHALS_03358 [Plasmopara halstedii]|eukprot:XP_024573059.1 hypothetical protein PHALS_03358 [Plasmopara halstedii]
MVKAILLIVSASQTSLRCSTASLPTKPFRRSVDMFQQMKKPFFRMDFVAIYLELKNLNAIPKFLQSDRVAESNYVFHLASAFRPQNARPQSFSTPGYDVQPHSQLCISEFYGKISATQNDITDPATGCRNHSFIQSSLRSPLGGSIRSSTVQLLVAEQHCRRVDNGTTGQENDHCHAVEESVEKNLAELMKEMHVTNGVKAYIAAEPVECTQDVIDRVGLDAD